MKDEQEKRRASMLKSNRNAADCWDNAPTESLWGRLKVGTLYGRRFATRREAMDKVMDWLTLYNHKRLHSTLGYVGPMAFEQRWIAAPAARQEVRIMGSLWSADKRGKIS